MLRLLILDEDIRPRLAVELCRRGRPTTTVRQLGFRGYEDPDLIAALASEWPDVVLVTTDNQMPLEHADALESRKTTLAIVGPSDGELPELAWESDVLHRWAHSMQLQPPGSLYRYSRSRPRPWTAPKRPPRLPRSGAGR